MQKLRYLLHFKTKLNWRTGTPARTYRLEGSAINEFRNTEPEKMFVLEHPTKCFGLWRNKSLITLHIWDVRTKISSSYPWTSQPGLDVAQKFEKFIKGNLAHHIAQYVSVANILGNVVLLNVTYPQRNESEIFCFDIGEEGILNELWSKPESEGSWDLYNFDERLFRFGIFDGRPEFIVDELDPLTGEITTKIHLKEINCSRGFFKMSSEDGWIVAGPFQQSDRLMLVYNVDEQVSISPPCDLQLDPDLRYFFGIWHRARHRKNSVKVRHTF